MLKTNISYINISSTEILLNICVPKWCILSLKSKAQVCKRGVQIPKIKALPNTWDFCKTSYLYNITLDRGHLKGYGLTNCFQWVWLPSGKQCLGATPATSVPSKTSGLAQLAKIYVASILQQVDRWGRVVFPHALQDVKGGRDLRVNREVESKLLLGLRLKSHRATETGSHKETKQGSEMDTLHCWDRSRS